MLTTTNNVAHATSDRPIDVIYIAGAAHSGTRVVTQYLRKLGNAYVAGQLKHINDLSHECSCGIRPASVCPVWHDLLSVAATSPNTSGSGNSRQHTADIDVIESIQARHPGAIVVDSSTTTDRLQRLINDGRFSVVAVWVKRSPSGIVSGHVRKGRSWRLSALNEFSALRKLQLYFDKHPHIAINIVDFARNPEEAMQPLLTVCDSKIATLNPIPESVHEIGIAKNPLTSTELRSLYDQDQDFLDAATCKKIDRSLSPAHLRSKLRFTVSRILRAVLSRLSRS